MKQSDNVIFVDFALTPEQRRFKEMLSMYPCLQAFWNFEQRTCDTDALLLNWDEFSGDEQEMARFFVSMWQPGNVLQFNVMQAMQKLGDSHWQVIDRWMSTLEEPEVVSRMMQIGSR